MANTAALLQGMRQAPCASKIAFNVVTPERSSILQLSDWPLGRGLQQTDGNSSVRRWYSLCRLERQSSDCQCVRRSQPRGCE